MRSSSDGVEWSEERILVSASMQYYCKFQLTTDPNRMRICMYSNPSAADPNIRMGFYDPQTGQLFDADAVTPLGDTGVSSTSFTTIIAKQDGHTQRLFDVAVSDPNRPRILFATIGSGRNPKDSTYYLYDTGETRELCHGGLMLMDPKYPAGAAFLGDHSIVVARNADGQDSVEVYDCQDGIALAEVVCTESSDGNVRNARPITDVRGRAFLWHSGYYNPKKYTDYSTSARVCYYSED